MKKVLTLTAVLLLVAAVLCACDLGSPAPAPEPTTMEHTHSADVVNNDESYHFQVCSCGEVISQQAHTFSGDWILVKGDGGCDDYSAFVRNCDGCNFQEYREEEPSGHEFVEMPMKEPTCSEEGYNGYMACAKCGFELDGRQTIPATGTHEYGNDGICTICGTPCAGSEGLELTLSKDGKYYIVSGSGTCTDEYVFIPVEYNGKPVRVVGENAFTGNGTMVMVGFYSNVKIIEDNAFMGCWNLENVQFAEGLEYIGYNAFGRLEEDKTLVISDLPDSLEYVGDWAFSGCTFHELVIPKNLNIIGEGAFDSKQLLTITCHPQNKTFYVSGNCLIEKSSGKLITTGYGQINIPDDGSVKSILTCAFAHVGAEVTEYYIPASVTYIESYAFAHYGWEITVHFGGTREQWENITTSGYISDNMEHLIVICADEE